MVELRMLFQIASLSWISENDLPDRIGSVKSDACVGMVALGWLMVGCGFSGFQFRIQGESFVQSYAALSREAKWPGIGILFKFVPH